MREKLKNKSDKEVSSTEQAFLECRGSLEILQPALLASIFLGLETWGAGELLSGEWNLAVGLFLHFLATGLLGLWVYWRYQKRPGERLPPLLLIAGGFFGPLGCAGFLLLLGLYCCFKNQPTPLPELYGSIFPEIEKEDIEHLFDHLISGNRDGMEQNSIVPFMDVLRNGTQKQKHAMLVLVTNHFDSRFAPVLKEALADPDNSVRVLAAMGKSKIENQFTERNLNLKKSKREEPSPEAAKNLGEMYDDYAHSGILDSGQEEEYRHMAMENYEEYLRFHPEDLSLRFTVNRMLLKSGKLTEAANGFEESIQNGFKTPNLLFWYFECLYRLGRFDKLRQQIQEHREELIRDKDKFPFDILEVIGAWMKASPNTDDEPVQSTGQFHADHALPSNN